MSSYTLILKGADLLTQGFQMFVPIPKICKRTCVPKKHFWPDIENEILVPKGKRLRLSGILLYLHLLFQRLYVFHRSTNSMQISQESKEI